MKIEKINKGAKYTSFTLITAVLIVFVVWLWQRQPIQNSQTATPKSATTSAQSNSEQNFKIAPKDGSVITSSKVKLQGQTTPSTFVVIYTNDTSQISQTDSAGNFNQEVELTQGLNLINIATVSQNLEKISEQSFNFFIAQDKDQGDIVFTGSVKTIFDKLITISTNSADKNVRTTNTTQFTFPEISEDDIQEQNSQPVKNVRIGDYLIATGDQTNQNSLVAKMVQIERQNKPQISKIMFLGKTASSVRTNIFSVKDQKGEVAEFTINKNSEISQDNKQLSAKEIAKDKNAIIFYHQDGNKNIINLIYLLP